MKPLRLLFAAILAASVFSIALHQSGSAVPIREVTVQGTGTATLTPDAVKINTTISARSSSTASALSQASASAATLRAALTTNKTSPITPQYIQTSQLTVAPEYNYGANNKNTFIDYLATQSFSITVRKGSTAGDLVDAMTSAVGNNLSIDSVTPFIFDPTAGSAQARAAAMADATTRAQSYAALAHSKLGKVISIDESSTQSTPTPMMAMAKSATSMAAPTQIDLGQQDVTVSVTVVWGLK